MAGFLNAERVEQPLPREPRDPRDLDPVTAASRRRALRALGDRRGTESLLIPLSSASGQSVTSAGIRIPPPT